MSSRNREALLGSSSFDAVASQPPVSPRGRALAAFDGKPAALTPDRADQPAVRARLDQLAHNPFNPRETLTEIKDIADSLEVHGVIQPLTVVTRGAFLSSHPGQEERLGDATFVVLDGNRRLAGANLAGLEDVPVHVDDSKAATADDMLESALVAAVQHVAIEPLDQAKALNRLVAVHGSQRQVAKRLGKSHVWVSQRLALLNLTPELQQAVEEKAVPVEVARAVGRLPQEGQEEAVKQALEQRANAPKRAKKPSAADEAAQRGGNAVSTPAAVAHGAQATGAGGNAVSTGEPAGSDQALPEQRSGGPADAEPAAKIPARDRVAQLGTSPVEWAQTLREGCSEAELDELLDALTQ